MASEIKLKRDITERSRHLKAQRSSTIHHESDVSRVSERPDRWLSGEPGAEHRYGRHPRTLTPAQAYKQGAALKTQTSTHSPFYFEDLGREPAPESSVEARAPRVVSPPQPLPQSPAAHARERSLLLTGAGRRRRPR